MVIQELGFPKLRGEQVPDCIRRAAVALGISERHAKSYWYGQVDQPDPYLYRQALELVEARNAKAPGHDFSGLQKQVTELERQLVRARKDIDCLLDSASRKSNARRGSEADLFGQDNRSLA